MDKELLFGLIVIVGFPSAIVIIAMILTKINDEDRLKNIRKKNKIKSKHNYDKMKLSRIKKTFKQVLRDYKIGKYGSTVDRDIIEDIAEMVVDKGIEIHNSKNLVDTIWFADN